MDAIYFDINPEMGLQAQQDFQTLVYEHLYTIISFLLLFQQYASDYEFFQQFLNNDGVPFRMQASVYLQQLRIALTARCGHFIECFRLFDEETVKLKNATNKRGGYIRQTSHHVPSPSEARNWNFNELTTRSSSTAKFRSQWMVNIRLTKAQPSSHAPLVFIEIDQDKIPELQHPLLHLMQPLMICRPPLGITDWKKRRLFDQ